MDKIWANRLLGGTKTWGEVSDNRKPGVKAELKRRVAAGMVSAETYKAITGEEVEA